MIVVPKKELTAAERETALTYLKRGRYQLGQKHPHFGYASWKLSIVEDLKCQTLYTNGQIIAYNPAYVIGCSDDQYPNYTYAVSAIIHETLHALLGHCKDWGALGYDRMLTNAAQDYAINLILRHDLKMPVHKDWLCDDKYKGMTWFEIYDILKADQDKNPTRPEEWGLTCKVDPQPSGGGGSADGDGEKDGQGDGKSDCPGLPPCDEKAGHTKGTCPCPCHPMRGDGGGGEGGQQQKNDWDKIAVEAARFAQSIGHGDLPAFLEDLVEKVTKPVVDWKTVVERWVSRCKKGDYSFRRLNKRYMGSGLVMPSLHSYTADLVIAIDTSGSTWGFLNRFWGEVYGIIKAVGVETHVIQCDTHPKVFKLRKPEDVLKMKRTGGGGTDFTPVFDMIVKGWHDKQDGMTVKVKRPEAVVFFTDGEGTYPTTPPPFKTLWCIPNAQSLKGSGYYPPFGTVLSLPDNQ